ncbi:MAG TPA: hypothetical protein VE891_13955 [Allosphingosinicella sp.]|nr:hypothetical protein [Allosphingosinicella sp.]
MAKRSKGRGAIPRITGNKGRRLQVAGPSGRKLFDSERKERFLGYFCGEANLSWAARKVGVHYRTVLRHRATDPAFAEAYDLAEAQALPRLRSWLVQAKAQEAQTLKDSALGLSTGSGQAGAEDGPEDGAEDGAEDGEEPGGDIAPERLSVEQAMQFLRDHEQSQARRERAARMGPGRGNGRPVSVASNEEVKEALFRALRAQGIRVRAGMGTVTGDCPQGGEAPVLRSETPAPITPPPGSAWSPSPSKLGEDEQ